MVTLDLRRRGREVFSAFLLVASAPVGAGCKPELEGRPSAVDEDVVLAVRSSPAEVNPSDMPVEVVTYEALYVGPEGAADPSKLDWAFCDEAKPLAVTGPIAPVCLARRVPDITLTVSGGGDGAAPITQTERVLTPFGTGPVARSAAPGNGCRVFGPFPPEPLPGQPAARPADPDTTGGYYQPVRLLVPSKTGDDYAVGVTRLDCGIFGATQDQNNEYDKRHRPNENPAILSLTVTRGNGRSVTVDEEPGGSPVSGDSAGGGSLADGGASDAGAGPPRDAGISQETDAGVSTPRRTVSPGETVTFRASWARCAPPCSGANCAAPEPCTGSEAYLDLDLISHELVDRRESIRVSWYSNAGSFDHDRTGRTESDVDTPDTDNAWTAPSAAADVRLWLVIRDDRGGVGWSSYVIHVAP